MSSTTKCYHRLSSCRPWSMASPIARISLHPRGLSRSTDGLGVLSIRGYAGVRTPNQRATAEDQKAYPVSSSLDGRLQALVKSYGKGGRLGRVDVISEGLCGLYPLPLRPRYWWLLSPPPLAPSLPTSSIS